MKNKIIRNCLSCQKEFVTNREKKIYCSSNCRWIAWDKKHPRIHPGDDYVTDGNGIRISIKSFIPKN